MYLSKDASEYEEYFYARLQCAVIYSKPFRGGTLYHVNHADNAKQHSTLDKILTVIESDIEPGWVDSKFQVVSDVLNGKVKTFTANQHLLDELYCAVFSNATIGGTRDRQVQSDVKTWTATDRNSKVTHASSAIIDELRAAAAVSQVLCVLCDYVSGPDSVRTGHHQRAQGGGGGIRRRNAGSLGFARDKCIQNGTVASCDQFSHRRRVGASGRPCTAG